MILDYINPFKTYEYEFNGIKIELPVELVELVIPSTLVQGMEDTKTFVVEFEGLVSDEFLEKFIVMLFKMFLNDGFDYKCFDLIPRDLVAYYMFVDSYFHSDDADLDMIITAIKSSIVKHFLNASELNSYMDFYKFIYGDMTSIPSKLQSFIIKMGADDLLEVDPYSLSDDKVGIYSGSKNRKAKLVLRKLCNIYRPFKNIISETWLPILESMKLPGQFIGLIRGETYIPEKHTTRRQIGSPPFLRPLHK